MINFIKKYEEIINYLVIGFFTTLVSLLTYYLLIYTFFDPNNILELQITNIISWIFSVTFAYFTNRRFVFKSKNSVSLKEISSFYISRISTLILDMVMMYVFVNLFKFNDKIVKLVVQFIIIVLNYILSKFFVFSKRS